MSDYDVETGEIVEIGRSSPPAAQRDVMVPLASRQCDQVCNALAKAQGEFEAPTRSKKATVKGTTKTGTNYSYEYSYAPLEACIAAVQKPLAEAGVSRQQYIVWRGNMSFIRTILWHSSGQWLAADYPIIQDKDGMAGFAAACTYAKRQGLCLITGLAPEDDNDAEVEERPLQRSNGHHASTPPAPPRRPPPPEPPHDPVTGEIKPPHSIPVQSADGKEADWLTWGATFVAAIQSAQSGPVLEAWVAQNTPQIGGCEKGNAKVHARIMANIAAARKHFVPADPEPNFATEADAERALG